MNHSKFALRFSIFAIPSMLMPGLVLAGTVGGTQVGIQPRIELGLMNYSYEQSPVSLSVPSTPTDYGYNFTQSSLKFRDTLPVLGGGLTLFADRFFIDLSLQKSFSGEDQDGYSYSEFDELTPSSFYYGNPTSKTDFDREEYAISAGFAVTDQVAVYAGYKMARTDFSGRATGPGGAYFAADEFDPAVNYQGSVLVDQDIEFKHSGPFLGLTYGFDVRQGALNGRLSFNFAAAFLTGEVEDDSTYTLTLDSMDGQPLSQPIVVDRLTYRNPTSGEAISSSYDSKGDTVGLTFGVTWRGSTSIEGLGYSLGISGYSYDFAADRQTQPDITEAALMFKAGISYSF